MLSKKMYKIILGIIIVLIIIVAGYIINEEMKGINVELEDAGYYRESPNFIASMYYRAFNLMATGEPGEPLTEDYHWVSSYNIDSGNVIKNNIEYHVIAELINDGSHVGNLENTVNGTDLKGKILILDSVNLEYDAVNIIIKDGNTTIFNKNITLGDMEYKNIQESYDKEKLKKTVDLYKPQ
ncbi:hypothetical protein MBBWO_04330 [Methanobrevibacter woesei]|uniref:Uncharacterized protein n=1 Tax=Methanobrevibacter woesei TaxID=190976 RepID=A0A2U1S909_9EURY|nr:hypothetical protein [Methanobrevibacter woesei]PWB86719.1 hypothetical protein MBBWO_04330 [Methanobrevibacter woesei]